ncbi:MAG: cytochrome c oxidase subunit I [Gammaproteobacteria bacterium]|nr:cytochrome c oxidase subunit I [Gammaproteobacteria bacterium]
MTSFQLDSFTPEQIRISKGWFFLGIFALIASGVFSILLVLSRTPAISDFIPWIDFFHTALVVHVDLSVLIWFIAFSAIFWSLNNQKSALLFDQLVLLLTLIGTFLIISTPFMGQAHPVINNYIPVLNDRPFLAGLVLIAAAIGLLTIRSLLHTKAPDPRKPAGVLRFGIFLSIITVAMTLVAQYLSYANLQLGDNAHLYYEYLFWGSGHTLQFSHILLLYVAWFWLSSLTGSRFAFKPVTYATLFAISFFPVLLVPLIYFNFPVFSPEHLAYFSDLMRYGGIAAIPLGALLALKVIDPVSINNNDKPIRYAFIWSVVLFASGGILGFLIDGVNVVIPAHYHGSIVGVTLAFMGMSYLLLPVFGYTPPSGKLARYQPAIYASGQMMHIIGLAWSGGYGVQRKTAGAAQGLDSVSQVTAMGMMGLGGLIAIIGGTIFLVVVLVSIYRK